MCRSMLGGVLLALTLLATAGPVQTAERTITVASTTSTEQSGLFGRILPIFTKKTGIGAHVIAQGTGQALKTGEKGDADVVFVHDPESERRFVESGFGVKRHEVMYNDFVIVGPKSDPAGIAGTQDAEAALKRIAGAMAPFASRGDDSGTNKAELRLWRAAGIEPKSGAGSWYRETGSGMGPTLNIASAMGAYALTDRGTWLSFRNRGDLDILVEGDPRLFNQYGVILVNPERHPHVKTAEGRAFIDWLLSDEGQKAIAGYRVNGKQLFFPNASKAGG